MSNVVNLATRRKPSATNNDPVFTCKIGGCGCRLYRIRLGANGAPYVECAQCLARTFVREL